MRKLFLILLIVCSSSFIALSQGLWTQRTSLPDSARSAGVGFTISNYGYAGLGYSSSSYHDFWQFNPSSNKWVQKAKFPGRAVVWPTAFVIGHKAYVIGGTNTSTVDTCYRECWEYDATVNSWTKKNNFPGTARFGAIGFAIGKRGYIGTGSDSAFNNLNDFWQYDTATDTWTKKNNFPGANRYISTAFAVGGNGYLCFGSSDVSAYKDMWQYDTGSDSWTQKSNCFDSVCAVSGFVIGTNVYVGTGGDANGANNIKTFWKYNTLTDTWTQEANFLGTARDLCSSFAIGDTGYLGLGGDYSNSLFYNDWYKFYPDTLTAINEIHTNENGISIYPNPSNGVFTVKLPIVSSQSKMEVYNVLGEKVYAEIPKEMQSNYQINLSNEPVGVYILKVASSNSNFYTRIIIN